MKEFADDNFKFDKNGRKLSKRVENTVGKGEIARYEQFLLFPQCFQKACFPRVPKGAIVWEWVNLASSINSLLHNSVSDGATLIDGALDNTVSIFVLYPQGFLSIQKQIIYFELKLILFTANAFKMDWFKDFVINS